MVTDAKGRRWEFRFFRPWEWVLNRRETDMAGEERGVFPFVIDLGVWSCLIGVRFGAVTFPVQF